MAKKVTSHVRGKDYFNRIGRHVRARMEMQTNGRTGPAAIFALANWSQGAAQPDVVRIANDIRVREVYLRRFVYFDDAIGMARPDQALFGRLTRDERQHLDAATEFAHPIVIAFNASGAMEPGESLARKEVKSPRSHAVDPGR